jgi:predicted lipoprotein with Yx(FWY)xxD motif
VDENGNGLCDKCFNEEIAHSKPGDINGDGQINVGDVAKLYSHTRSIVLLDEAQLALADINGDGNVNIGDVANLYARVRNP